MAKIRDDGHIFWPNDFLSIRFVLYQMTKLADAWMIKMRSSIPNHCISVDRQLMQISWFNKKNHISMNRKGVRQMRQMRQLF